MQNGKIEITQDQVEEFCQRWQITQFALFGSVLSDHFREGSDVDVLVTISPDAPWDLFDLVKMRNELAQLFRREVDLVERGSLRNPFRRKAILSNLKVLYAT